MSLPPIVLEVGEQAAWIRLNRPEVHNAVDLEVVRLLEEAQEKLAGNPGIRVVVLTGSGDRTFCAGADLTYLASSSSTGEPQMMCRRMGKVLERFYRGPWIVVGACNGDAFGGGCEILTACHFILAVERARFSFRQAAVGLSTGWGGGVRLLEAVGVSVARRWLLSACVFDAIRAFELGWFHGLSSSVAGLRQDTEKLVERLLSLSKVSQGSFKTLIRALGTMERSELVKLERTLFDDCWKKEDFKSFLSRWSTTRSSSSGVADEG